MEDQNETLATKITGTLISLKALWDRARNIESKVGRLIAGHSALATEEQATANKNEIISAIPSVESMKSLYAARVEKNSDGDNTYTIVLPVTAQVIETPDGNEIII